MKKVIWLMRVIKNPMHGNCSSLGSTSKSKVLTGFIPSSYSSFINKSDQEIEDYCNVIKEPILSVIEENIWPECRQAVKTFKVIIPMDNYIRLLAPEGHIYGKRFRAQDIFFHRVPFHSQVKNLKFCSAFTSFPGLASCIRGALFLHGELTGKRV